MKNKSIFNKGFDLLAIAEIGMTHNGDYGLAVSLPIPQSKLVRM